VAFLCEQNIFCLCSAAYIFICF